MLYLCVVFFKWNCNDSLCPSPCVKSLMLQPCFLIVFLKVFEYMEIKWEDVPAEVSSRFYWNSVILNMQVIPYVNQYLSEALAILHALPICGCLCEVQSGL